MLAQGLFDLGGRHGLSPCHVDFHDLEAPHGGDLAPAFPELAAVDDDDLLARGEEPVHGGGHGPGARTGEGQYRLAGAKELLQHFFGFQQDFFEGGLAVMDHVRRQSETDALGQRGGAGGEQTGLVEQHGVSSRCSSRGQSFQTRRIKTFR